MKNYTITVTTMGNSAVWSIASTEDAEQLLQFITRLPDGANIVVNSVKE